MLLPLRTSLAVLCILVVSSCNPPNSGPVRVGGNSDVRLWTVDSELVKRYGDLPGKIAGEREVESEVQADVCLRQEFGEGGIQIAWVAVCGQILDAPHSESGWIDLMVLRGQKDSLSLVADSTHLESGSFGRPGGVSLVRLGKAQWAFVLSSQFSGQGEIVGSESWFTLDSAMLVEILSTRVLTSNEGLASCDYDSLGCRWEHRRLKIDSSDANAPFYPIALVDSARSNGSIRTRRGTFSYLSDSGRYILPEPLIPDF